MNRSTESLAPELEQKMIDIRRVTRVVKGGRRFSFSVVLIVGDQKGRVGLGLGKAGDIAKAIEKALHQAKKHLFNVPLTKEFSIPHETRAKFSSSEVVLRPAPGRGVVAGSAVRVILNLAGIKAISGKIISPSKNKLNNSRATMKALAALKPISK